MNFDVDFSLNNRTFEVDLGKVIEVGGDPEASYNEGYEAGQQAEYDRFWNSFQLNGTRVNYIQAFAGVGWKDDTYNPKYPITVSGGGNMLFNNNTSITSTKVPIIFDTAAYLSSIFNGCSSLNEITSIKVTEKVSAFGSWFDNCKNLQTINFTEDSVIGKSINFKTCPLNLASAKSVINALKNYAGTTSEYTYSVSFSDSTLALLEAEGATAPGGLTWTEYIKAKRWNY